MASITTSANEYRTLTYEAVILVIKLLLLWRNWTSHSTIRLISYRRRAITVMFIWKLICAARHVSRRFGEFWSNWMVSSVHSWYSLWLLSSRMWWIVTWGFGLSPSAETCSVCLACREFKIDSSVSEVHWSPLRETTDLNLPCIQPKAAVYLIEKLFRILWIWGEFYFECPEPGAAEGVLNFGFLNR